jgi:uncharacterized membrane protein HdeD (DUF308 family)
MRKSALFMPLAAIIAGAAGFALRAKELKTVFDAATGLARRGEPVTVALILLSLFVGAVFIVFGLFTMKKYNEKNNCSAIAPPDGSMLAVYIIIAFIMLIAAVMYLFESEHLYGKLLTTAFGFFALLTGASYILVPLAAKRGEGGEWTCVFSVIPALFFSFWLVASYRESAADPVLLNYCYECLALGALALSSYFYAGFAYSKAAPRATIAAGLISIYLSIVTLADTYQTSLILMLISACMAQTANTAVFLFRLERKL